MASSRTCEVYTHYDQDIKKQVQCGAPAVGSIRVNNPHPKHMLKDKTTVVFICYAHDAARKDLVLAR
jgi:hypothetical protein